MSKSNERKMWELSAVLMVLGPVIAIGFLLWLWFGYTMPAHLSPVERKLLMLIPITTLISMMFASVIWWKRFGKDIPKVEE